MRELFQEFLKTKGKISEPAVSDVPVVSQTRPRFSSEGSNSSSERHRRTRTRSRSVRRRTRSRSKSRKSRSRGRSMPKYLYSIDMPDDFRVSLRVSYFYLFL